VFFVFLDKIIKNIYYVINKVRKLLWFPKTLAPTAYYSNYFLTEIKFLLKR